MSVYPGCRCRAWKFQPTAQLNQVPPVTDTWYTILDTTEDVSLDFILMFQENDETDAKNIEVRVTIDGEVLPGAASQADNTLFYWAHTHNFAAATDILDESATRNTAGSQTSDKLGLPLRGHSVLVEARITSAVGTNQELRGRVIYQTWEAT